LFLGVLDLPRRHTNSTIHDHIGQTRNYRLIGTLESIDQPRASAMPSRIAFGREKAYDLQAENINLSSISKLIWFPHTEKSHYKIIKWLYNCFTNLVLDKMA
jgi:hypothetical protein